MARRNKAADEAKVDVRGQISVELDGTKFMLRPSNAAVLAYEEQTGLATYKLAGLAISGEMRLGTMGLIVAELMRAYGVANPDDPLITTYRAAKPERIAELIQEAGIPYVLPAIVAVLMGVLTGGYTASGEAKTPGS
jgi:hypothetical protein